MISEDNIENKIRSTVCDALDEAENNWNKVGMQLIEGNAALEDYSTSFIPGHPIVHEGKPIVDEFIAFVVDIRGSTSHLNSINLGSLIENGFQRIYYESTALLSGMAETISYFGGTVTEFLGDGALALFRIDPENTKSSLIEAINASKTCIDTTLKIVNSELHDRYNLEPLKIGIGLSSGKAMISLVGLKNQRHPKAIGTCVYYASKRSKGHNQVLFDTNVRNMILNQKYYDYDFAPYELAGVNEKTFLLEF